MPIGLKSEEKDNRQTLLDLIKQQWGIEIADTMEQGYKNKDKQIKDAMLNNGMSLEQLAQTQGVDFGLLDKLLQSQTGQTSPPAPERVAPMQQPQPQQQAQANQPYATKPASSPFGFGGATMQNGQVVEQQPGMIAGLLMSLISGNPKTSAKMDLGRLRDVAAIQQSSESNDLANQRLALSQERLELEHGMEKRRVGAEGRRKLEDTKNTIYNSGAEFTDEDLKDPDIARIVMPLIKQNNIEPIIDPETGTTFYSIPPKGVLDKVRKEIAAVNLKRKELAKELSDYFAVGDSLPTAEGWGRFAKGAELYAGSVFQSDKQGAMAAQLSGLNKRLRVKLVRAAGDVGNLNIVEQEAAERLLYNFNDSTSLRELKKGFLVDLTKALDDNSPMEIKKIVQKWMRQGTGGRVQSGLAPDKAKRLEELRKKKAAGTLGR